ncbi:MAG TPA: hypothetical protein VKE74_08880 [Gemmataceae bacterium]|nr:hypothetical protein [Gemmataceae bacterium]
MSSEQPAPTPPPTPTPANPRRQRRWLRLLAAFGGLLLLAVWFAPAIVAKTPLRNRIARNALADLRGNVEVGGASLGWFSPVELRDVTVKDAQGRTLLTAPKVTSSKSFLSLLRDRSDLGEFTIERPVVELVCEKQSTNLEDAIANFLNDDGTPPGPTRTAVSLRISDGKLALRDADTQKTWVFEAITAAVTVPRSRTEPVSVQLAATADSAKFTADLTLGDGGKAIVTAAAFPLEALAPAVRRLDPAVAVAGRLTANLTATWGGAKFALDGTASVKDLDLAGPWLNGDRLRLASADLPVKLEAVGNAVRIERAELTCDIGKLTAAGTFDPDLPFDKLFDQPGTTVTADIDLAKLAALLPRLLRVRDGTAITDGKLTTKLTSRGTPAGTTWDGEVRTSALKGTRDGRPVEWKEPFSIEFSGRFAAGQLPAFDKLVCRSDFIAINARSEPDSLRAAANIDLNALSERLSEFVDLGGARASGTAAAWVVAKRTPHGEFKAEAGLDLARFAFTDRTGKGLREDSASLRVSANGAAPAGGPVRIDNASLDLTAGADELHLTLFGAIPDARQLSTVAFSARLSGDLGRWMGRVRGFVRVPAHYVFGGTLSSSGVVRIEKEKVVIDRLTVAIQKVRFRGAGLDLDEPTLSAVADMTLTRATGATVFDNFQINGAPLSVVGGKLAFEPQPNGDLAVSGGGAATTDLTRLGRTLKLSTDPNGADALRGRGTGPIHFRWFGTTTTFVGTLDVKDFAYGRPAETGIAEPVLRLETDGRYEETTDTVTLNKARVERPGLVADGKGTFGKFDTTQDVALDGTLSYDLVKLTPDLRAAVGGGFEAKGHGTRPFSMKGSLSPGGVAVNLGAPKGPPPGPFAKMTGNAGLGWDSVQVYGFVFGPGELTAGLANGSLSVSPIRAAFAGSQVVVTPTARLDPAPAELTFAKGKIVDRAKLTPQALAGGLGYVLPAIANATQAEGEVTMVLDENRIPLDDFSKATVKGQLVVHKATVSAGPLVTELSKLLGGPPTHLTLANEMVVPVKVEGGRVYHENFSLSFNGVVVKTSGSVGFDGSLALVADLPVPAEVFKGNPRLMQALSGKRVQIPVTGTVSKPAIDPRLFQAAVANVARDAAKDVGRDVLNKELEKLLPPGGGPLMPSPPKK